MSDRRETNKINSNSSGIADDMGPEDQLLDDVLLEVRESDEEGRKN